MDISAVSKKRNPTRAVQVGKITIGNGNPIVVQSMCATKTTEIEATVIQIDQLAAAGAGIVRVAVDTRLDCKALARIRDRTQANLSVDLQENYPLAAEVAPWVDKIRYNPGHLYHFQREKPWQDKVKFLVDAAVKHNCALRVGVNCGSVDSAKVEKYAPDDELGPMLESAMEHCEMLDRLGFTRYCVSLKHTAPGRVVEINRRFAAQRPDVPLHLGVTEAGLPPDGILKSRLAFEQLLLAGIGDTLRVSLTLPVARKHEEVLAGIQIISDVAEGRLLGEEYFHQAEKERKQKMEIISCPSCSRVENEKFCELAEKVREATRYAAEYPITIAVMGCRVNGPGETDKADLGLWCGRTSVNFKRRNTLLGSYSYEEIIPRLKVELDALIAQLTRM